MSRIMTRRVSITTVGNAGQATGSADLTDLHGYLVDVFVNWHTSAPASSVLTVVHEDPAEGTILTTPAGNTDTLYAPRKQACGANGAGVAWYDRYLLNGKLTFTVTLSNALTGAAVVTIRYLRD